ncbi:hypothetical protein V2J09_020017 [Rumex salicifolius]
MGIENGLPYLGMIMSVCAQVGLMIVSKVAMADGMSNLVFICYSNALASLVILPFIFFFHRRESRLPLTLPIIGGFFMLGLLGFAAQILGYTGLYYSNPTLGTALLNLVPGFTFILAIVFRMERVYWRSPMFLAKTVGTLVSVAGALIVTLYQGPPILNSPSPIVSLHYNLLTQQTKWIIGGLLLIADCVMASSWLILQAYVLKRYPAELIVVLHYFAFVAVQSGVVILIVERDFNSWNLMPKVRWMAILYSVKQLNFQICLLCSAVFGSAFQVGVASWCLHKKGPVFVSMFKPLGIAIAAVFGVMFSNDTFYLGSLIGIIVIIIGFYSVLWGKAKEEKKHSASEESSLPFSIHEALLQHNEIGQNLKNWRWKGGLSNILEDNVVKKIYILKIRTFYKPFVVTLSGLGLKKIFIKLPKVAESKFYKEIWWWHFLFCPLILTRPLHKASFPFLFNHQPCPEVLVYL